MKKIIGISGRVEAGKTTLAKNIKNTWDISSEIINFAQTLKENICEDILGMSKYQIYDKDGKNTKTHIRWKDIPGVVTKESLEEEWGNALCDWFPTTEEYRNGDVNFFLKRINLQYQEKSGFMTGREVMEYVGTGFFRKIYPDCWVNAVKKKIEKSENSNLIIIDDVRNSNEIDLIKSFDGIIIRLTNNPKNRMTKIETALDINNYNYDNFDLVLNNKDFSPDDTLKSTEKLISNFLNKEVFK